MSPSLAIIKQWVLETSRKASWAPIKDMFFGMVGAVALLLLRPSTSRVTMQRLLILLLVFIPVGLYAGDQGELVRARAVVASVLKDISPGGDAIFGFKQTSRQLAHLRRPWQTWNREFAGTFLVADNATSFYQIDSLQSGRAVYSSYKYCCDTTLAIISYGDTVPQKLSLADKLDFLYDVSTLTPVFLLKDFLANCHEGSFIRYVVGQVDVGEVDTIVFRKEDGNIVAIAIDPERREVRSVSITYSQDLYGDVVSTLQFTGYRSTGAGGFKYPTKITESKLGFDANSVSVELKRGGSFDRERILAMIPATYRLAENKSTSAPLPEVASTRYNPHIHFVDLKHTGERSMIVEFSDFLLVAEAPLNTKNGEMLLREAEKIAPGKPVRYFVFGHYHPHYLGGVRAFIHYGATIISTPGDSAYVAQIASFKHTIAPDSLAIDPQPLKLRIMSDSQMVVNDGALEMQIINIGAMSRHADNYLIYYFPKYKLLFVDEGIWVAANKPLAAAGDMQKGLYEAIVAHKLDVETILRGWQAINPEWKSETSFKELQQSVEMMPAPR
jgi:hypothetical protein